MWSIKDGFRPPPPAADVIRLFGEKLNIFCIAAVPQANTRPRLILNLSAQLDANRASTSKSTDREAAP